MYRSDEEPDRLLVVAEGRILKAVDVKTGEDAWRLHLTDGSPPADLAIDRGRVVILLGKELACVSLESGEGLWKASLRGAAPPHGMRSVLLVHEGRAYASAGRWLSCVDLESGEVLWANECASELGRRTFGFGGNVRPMDIDQALRNA